MRLLRSFPAMAFALVLLSIAGLCAAQHSVGLLLVTGTLAALSWSVTEGPRGRTLPHWVSNILLVGVVLNTFRDHLQSPGDVMGVLGRFTLLLTLVKLYERRTARDYAQLLALSLVLMITGCMQSNDLVFGVVLLLYVILGLYVLLLFQLHAAYELARDARQEATPKGYRLAPLLRPIIGRHAGLHFRLLALTLGMAGFALSVALFIAFPRGLGVDLFGTLRNPTSDRATGFSWEVNLNTGGRINHSAVRVMSLQFSDGERPLRMEGPVYLRGAVLDRYQDPGVWTQSTRNEASSDPYHMTSGSYKTLSQGDGRMITQRITLSLCAIAGAVPLFSIYAPVGMSVDGTLDLLYDPRRQTLRTTSDNRRLVGYTIRAQPDPSDATLATLTEGAEPTRGSWFFDRSGEVAKKARALLTEAGLPEETPSRSMNSGRRRPGYSNHWEWNQKAAQVFTDYLHGSEFFYTLDLSDVPLTDSDPVIAFLLGSKRGHCEHFASALVAMCHSVDIPARMVVGYIAQHYDEEAQEYAVLEGNAHAWVEVATGPHRWMTLDPTPPAALPRLTDDSGTLANTMRSVYQRFEGEWSTGVVGFDTMTQDRLMDSLSQGWTRRITQALESVRESMERINIFFNVGVGGYIWMGIVALVLAIAVIALVKLMRRSMAIRRTLQLQHVRGREYRQMLHKLGFYMDMLHVLQKGGLRKPDWQPPLSFAATLENAQPRLAGLVRHITDVFYRARYGHADVDARQVETARENVRELAEALRVRR